MKKSFSILLVLALFISCDRPATITGLWEVTSVSIGDENMTPQGRWMRFYEDGSQESGNGWYKHSEGDYLFDLSTSLLEITNWNGIKDPNDAFKVTIQGDQMTWTREEDGQALTVALEKIQKLPMTSANATMGLWVLDKVTYDGEDISELNNPENNRYLHLRWDGVFIDQNGPEGRLRGPYRMHGHNPQIELIYYGDCARIDSYDYEVSKDKLILSNSEQGSLVMTYHRSDEYPN